LAAVNQDGTVNSPSNPAKGGSIISIWVDGLMDPMYLQDASLLTDGAIISPSLVPLVTFTPAPGLSTGIAPSVSLFPVPNGASPFYPAAVTYAGVAPDLVAGITQINFQIPTIVPTGNFSVLVSIGGPNGSFSAGSRALIAVAP
jgi:hypothetical protein